MKKLSKEDLKNTKITKEDNSGCLHIIATPIGNFEDISLRAIKLLKNVDILICEDTRKTKLLLSHLKIKRKNLISYHDKNAYKKRPFIINQLLTNKILGIVCDAGTPLISDPGYKLIKECISNKIKVTHAPGPTSVICGLILSGLPINQFYFGGFVSSKETLKRKQFLLIKDNTMTGVWFDTCLRLSNTLKIMLEVFGNRKISLTRELTKTHEEVISCDLENIENYIKKRKANNNPLRGEIILVLEGHKENNKFDIEALNVIIKNKLQKLSLRDTVNEIVMETKYPKKIVYNYAIKIKKQLLLNLL